MASTLEMVRSALQQDHRVIVVADYGSDHADNLHDLVVTRTIVLACTEPTYCAETLQCILLSLTPRIMPTCIDNFGENDLWFDFGKLYFDEDVARIAVTLLVKGVRLPSSVNIRRRTWVYLYPSTEFVERMRQRGFITPSQICRTNLLPRAAA